MKKTILLTLLVLTSGIFIGNVSAQNTEKQAKKEIKKKPFKDARKEAKRWSKEGFMNLPGDVPLDKQFERSLIKQYLYDESGNPKYLSATGTAIAGSESVANANAMDNARLNLAGQVQSEITALISNNKANSQYTTEEVETIDEFISNSKTLIQTQLGSIEQAIRMMKKTENNLVEFRYTVLYDLANAKVVAKNIIRKELKEKLNENEEDLDKILGL